MEELAKRFSEKGFHTAVFSSGEEAVKAVLELIGRGKTVGIGGSKTVDQLSLYDLLQAQDNRVIWHWKEKDKLKARRESLFSDFYLCSSNAVTRDGKLVNIDGTGNRAAAMMFGPKNLIFLVGKNKIVDDVEAGILRIKDQACGPNARRQNLNVPCAFTNRCADCHTKDRMCNLFLVHEYPSKGIENTYLFFIDEELGL